MVRLEMTAGGDAMHAEVTVFGKNLVHLVSGYFDPKEDFLTTRVAYPETCEIT